MPVSKARKRIKKSGHPEKGGRFASVSSSQALALRLVGRAALILAVCALASSTLTDPLQKLADDSLHMAGSQSLSTFKQQERLALLRRTAQDTDGVRHLSPDELTLLFGNPSLKREEPEVESWHFTSSDCALDVYFPRHATLLSRHPVYAEYRVRGEADDDTLRESPQKLDHRACVKSLFAHAKFPTNG